MREHDTPKGPSSLARPNPHQSLFKYINLDSEASWQHLERTLRVFELSGSPASSLNDPFEMAPTTFNDLTPSVIRSIVSNLTEDPQDRESGLFGEDSLKKLAGSSITYLNEIISRSRVISFCERSDSQLLWAHYANRYRGACLHFVGGAFENVDRVGYVSYSSYRPIYPLSLALKLHQHEANSDNFDARELREESEKICFFTKSIDWSYENEVRIVYDGAERICIPFSKDGLISIIVGPAMDQSGRDRLRAMVKNSGLRDIRVRNASLSKTSFSVEIEN